MITKGKKQVVPRSKITARRSSAKADKNACDRLFSQLVRASGPCLKCGGTADETSHIYSRRYSVIRCDFDNAFPACHKCHRWWHDRPIEAVSWLHETLPSERLERLRLKAQDVGTKIDWHLKRQELQDLIKQLGVDK